MNKRAQWSMGHDTFQKRWHIHSKGSYSVLLDNMFSQDVFLNLHLQREREDVSKITFRQRWSPDAEARARTGHALVVSPGKSGSRICLTVL